MTAALGDIFFGDIIPYTRAPPVSVLSCTPRSGVTNAEDLEGRLPSTLAALFGTTWRVFSMQQFAKKQLGQPMVWHASNVSCPAKLGLQ